MKWCVGSTPRCCLVCAAGVGSWIDPTSTLVRGCDKEGRFRGPMGQMGRMAYEGSSARKCTPPRVGGAGTQPAGLVDGRARWSGRVSAGRPLALAVRLDIRAGRSEQVDPVGTGGVGVETEMPQVWATTVFAVGRRVATHGAAPCGAATARARKMARRLPRWSEQRAPSHTGTRTFVRPLVGRAARRVSRCRSRRRWRSRCRWRRSRRWWGLPRSCWRCGRRNHR